MKIRPHTQHIRIKRTSVGNSSPLSIQPVPYLSSVIGLDLADPINQLYQALLLDCPRNSGLREFLRGKLVKRRGEFAAIFFPVSRLHKVREQMEQQLGGEHLVAPGLYDFPLNGGKVEVDVSDPECSIYQLYDEAIDNPVVSIKTEERGGKAIVLVNHPRNHNLARTFIAGVLLHPVDVLMELG